MPTPKRHRPTFRSFRFDEIDVKVRFSEADIDALSLQAGLDPDDRRERA